MLPLAVESSGFAATVAALRNRAAERHPRLCEPADAESFAELSFHEARSLYEQAERCADDASRYVRCWRSPPASPSGGDYYAGEGRHYVGALERAALGGLGSASYAAALHEHVRDEPLVLDPIGHPAPQGPVASRCAAYVTGASYTLGGATAMRQAWRAHRPPPPAADETFSLCVQPKERER